MSWMLFDNATVGFFTLVLIFIYAPYFVSQVAETPIKGQEIWGIALGVGGIFVSLLSPVLGAIADNSGQRKAWLFVFSIMIVGGLIPLYFSTPGDTDNIPFYMASLVIAFVGVRLATSFTNAMIPELAPERQIGRLSGNGVALGNLGALILIFFTLGCLVANPETGKTLIGIDPILGINPSQFQGERATPLLAALWYVVFVIPLFLFTPDTKALENKTTAVKGGIRHLKKTVKQINQRPSYFTFLVAVLFYRNGISTLFAFGGIYAVGVLQLSVLHTGIFGILAILFGAIGAWIGGHLNDKLGAKRVILGALILLIVNCVIVVSITRDYYFFVIPVTSHNTVLFLYLAAGAIAGATTNIALSASRTLLVQQIDRQEATEAFGLYEFSSRVTAFTGPLAVSWFTNISNSQRIGIIPIIILLTIGAICLARIKAKT